MSVPGAIGLMALQAAKAEGAGQVVVFETAARRQELAMQTGASALIDPSKQDPVEAVAELTNGAGADVVIECAGVAATGVLAGQVARRQGRVVVMGVFEKPALLDYTDLVYGEKTVTGSMGGYGVFDEAIQMMLDGRFNGEPLITGRIGLDDILETGFKALIEHKDENVKILVSPS